MKYITPVNQRRLYNDYPTCSKRPCWVVVVQKWLVRWGGLKNIHFDCTFDIVLRNDIIPVVMGAAPEDYKRVAPPHSYIHVDDFESPRELADYLIKLDRNDDLYNEYFGWKGAWHHMETSFWCRLCAMLYKPRSSHSYSDLERWWRGPGVCIGKEQWRNKPRISKFIADNYDISSCGSSFRATYLFFFTIQWTLVITTLFVTKDFAVKSNLLS